MAYLSELIEEFTHDIHMKKFVGEMSKCISCGEKITNGGMWAMNEQHIGICKECAPILLDLYIDTLLDTGIIDENNDIESIKKLSNDIIVRYERKKEKKMQHNKTHL